jgi:hypothetical protein
MKFCKKCEKNTPTVIVKGVEECMVCGSEIKSEPEILPKNMNATKEAIRSLRGLTKTDEKTGKYTQSEIVGRNVSIGFLLILMGILYAIGGLTTVFYGIAIIVAFLFVAAVFIYIAAMRD